MSILHRLGLTFIKNIGPATAKSMLAHFGDEEQIFKASKSKLMQVPGIGEKRYINIDFKSALQRAEEELNYVERNNVKPVFYTDPEYPKRLKNCIDAPILLYAKG